jgi:tRNA(Ile)-lysidine synthase
MTKVQSLVKFILGNLGIKHDEKIAVAVSGGSDSLGLAFILKELGINIVAVTIDHKLRDESTAESVSVNQLLRSHNIEHNIITWQHDKLLSGNMQAQAREARYKLLTLFCKENKIQYLCVAHNKSDVAENFMIRLERGSGLDGLSAMPYIKKYNDINIVRPLLDVAKKDIQNYLINKNITWFEDPSNQNILFDRVRIRKEFENKTILQERVVTAACHLRTVRDYLSIQLKDKIEKIIYLDPLGFITIAESDFKNLHQYEQETILIRCLQFIGDKAYKARYVSLTKVIDNILNSHTSNITLLGCNIRIYKNKIFIYPECKLNQEKIIASNNFIWQNKFKINIKNDLPNNVTIEMLGKFRWQYLNKNNIHIPENIPIFIIYSLPCFILLEKVLAIPHIKYYSNKQFFDVEILPILTKDDI